MFDFFYIIINLFVFLELFLFICKFDENFIDERDWHILFHKNIYLI